MILWTKTKETFGIDQDTVKNVDKVVVACDNCNEESIKNYRTYKKTFEKHGRNFCHACTMSSDEHKRRCSVNATKSWESDEYKRKVSDGVKVAMSDEVVKEKVSVASKRSMADQTVRDKIARGVSSHLARPEVRAVRSEKMKVVMADPARKALVAESNRKMWLERRDELIAAVSMAMSSPEVSKIISDSNRVKWSDQEYRNTQIDAIKTAMGAIDIKNKMSDSAKRNWADDGYRTKILAILANPEIRLKISEASKENWKNNDYRERMANCRASQLLKTSSIQLQLYEYLDDLDVPYEKEGLSTVIGYYTFDCLVPKCGSMAKSLLIECQGDYWHSLLNAQRNDKSKFTYIERYFPDHEIMYVWEHEFATKDRVLDRLKLKLGIDLKSIDFSFRDVTVGAVDGKKLRSFLNNYHYLGRDRGGITVGAYLGDELIGCVVYSSPIRQNAIEQFGCSPLELKELSRLCIHPSYHKKNFASWLISKSLSFTKAKFVVSYADTTVGHSGAIYKAANFAEHHRVDPDYWYIDRDGYVMHKKTLYGKAKSLKMTENEYADKYGYFKKWGGEKICFVREL